MAKLSYLTCLPYHPRKRAVIASCIRLYSLQLVSIKMLSAGRMVIWLRVPRGASVSNLRAWFKAWSYRV